MKYSSNSSFLFAVRRRGQHKWAWSVTVTPTWQKGITLVRGDLLYVGLSDQSIGFGKTFSDDGQFRAMLEVGVSF